MAFIYISNGPGTIIEKLDNHFGSNDFFCQKSLSRKAGVICTPVATWVVRREEGRGRKLVDSSRSEGTWTVQRRSHHGPQLASEGGRWGTPRAIAKNYRAQPSRWSGGERGGTLKNPVLASQAAQSEEGTGTGATVTSMMLLFIRK